MHLDKESATLIQNHLRDTTGRDWSIATITARPYYKQIWAWWKALAYYKMNNHYETLEDAPEGLNSIRVMGDDTDKMYMWRNGRYLLVQEMTEDEIKGYYGE